MREVEALPQDARDALLQEALAQKRKAEADVRAIEAQMAALPLEAEYLRLAVANEGTGRVSPVTRQPAGAGMTMGGYQDIVAEPDAAPGGGGSGTDAAELARMASARRSKALAAGAALGSPELEELWDRMDAEVLADMRGDLAEVHLQAAAVAREASEEQWGVEVALPAAAVERCVAEARAARDTAEEEAEATTRELLASMQDKVDRMAAIAADKAAEASAALREQAKALQAQLGGVEAQVEAKREELVRARTQRRRILREFGELRDAVALHRAAEAKEVATLQAEVAELEAKVAEARSPEAQARMAAARREAEAEADRQADEEVQSRIKQVRAAMHEQLRRMKAAAAAKARAMSDEIGDSFAHDMSVALRDLKARREATARRMAIVDAAIDAADEQLAALAGVTSQSQNLRKAHADDAAAVAELAELRRRLAERWGAGAPAGEGQSVPTPRAQREFYASLLERMPPNDVVAGYLARKARQLEALARIRDARREADKLDFFKTFIGLIVGDTEYVPSKRVRAALEGAGFVLPEPPAARLSTAGMSARAKEHATKLARDAVADGMRRRVALAGRLPEVNLRRTGAAQALQAAEAEYRAAAAVHFGRAHAGAAAGAAAGADSDDDDSGGDEASIDDIGPLADEEVAARLGLTTAIPLMAPNDYAQLFAKEKAVLAGKGRRVSIGAGGGGGGAAGASPGPVLGAGLRLASRANGTGGGSVSAARNGGDALSGGGAAAAHRKRLLSRVRKVDHAFE